ncbi:CYIR protein [Plasmodium cynomolgi strain B]|uniref:CYIR protein n=1 Tax=Plasmodium cynomolgi (strain B) TaxID=1120755 RepID=K6VJ00_PLACD|nr:CYIR protein [Plasmodium cynomolgi strain B]GAB69367.1 CYIR protein [Plasmodium cynomolgi strain B]
MCEKRYPKNQNYKTKILRVLDRKNSESKWLFSRYRNGSEGNLGSRNCRFRKTAKAPYHEDLREGIRKELETSNYSYKLHQNPLETEDRDTFSAYTG